MSGARFAAQLDRAYSGAPPGSQARWLRQQPERLAAERRRIRLRAEALHRRVHGPEESDR